MPAMAVHVIPMWNPGQEKDFNSSDLMTDKNMEVMFYG